MGSMAPTFESDPVVDLFLDPRDGIRGDTPVPREAALALEAPDGRTGQAGARPDGGKSEQLERRLGLAGSLLGRLSDRNSVHVESPSARRVDSASAARRLVTSDDLRIEGANVTRLSGCRHCRQPDNSRNGRCQVQ